MAPPLPVAALQDIDHIDEMLRKQKLAEYKAELDRQIEAKQQAKQQDEAFKRPEQGKPGGLVAPTPADLLGLLKLCGSEDSVIDYLARVWGMDASTIAPTVRGWIKALPAVPPPSRQRSAPPAAPSFGAPSTSTAVLNLRGKQQPENNVIQICRIKTPPASAPVKPSAPALMSAMRAVNARLNDNAYGRKPLAATQRFAVGGPGGNFRASLGPLPPSVPEGAQLDFGSDQNAPRSSEDAALAAYMERSKFLHGGTKLAPASGAANAGMKSGPSGWNPSF